MSSPEALLAAVAKLDVASSESKYRPGQIDGVPTPGVTWCNKYLEDLLAELGLLIPAGMLAHYQIYWLDSAAGKSLGWQECTTERAEIHAEHGLPVVASWLNWLNATGHSHVALLVPPPPGHRGLYVTQAGAYCYACAPLTMGFGHNLVRFHFHD